MSGTAATVPVAPQPPLAQAIANRLPRWRAAHEVRCDTWYAGGRCTCGAARINAICDELKGMLDAAEASAT